MTQVMAPVDVAVRARFFRGLADPSRLAILEALRNGELGASEIALATGLSLSNASRHLACLRDCGLLEARQVWRNVYYRLAGPHVEHLLSEADLVLEIVAERIQECRRPEMNLASGAN
jgi:DNA-binding transcriptional ArsR family regulator